MLRFMPAAAALFVALAIPAAAQPATNAVIDHHIANMKIGNLAGVMSDYAPDAVVVTPTGLANASGVFAGAETRKLFSVLTDKAHLPGNKTLQLRYDIVAPDTTIMHWVQFRGTTQKVSGYDVFVVRGGTIVFQTVTVNPSPKLMPAKK